MTSTPNLRRFSSSGEFISESVATITHALKNGGALSLSGGRTPQPVYETLAAHKILSKRIRVFEVDERYVPRNHQDSNRRMMEEALGRGMAAFDTTKPIAEALTEYEKMIRPSQPFDLTILGMGPDGHTASLFPRSPALYEKNRLVAHTTTDAFAVHDRLTLTFPAILRSKHLLLLLSGKDKHTALDTLLQSNVSFEDFPAKKLLEHPRLTIHYHA